MARLVLTIELELGDFFKGADPGTYREAIMNSWQDRAVDLLNESLEYQAVPYRVTAFGPSMIVLHHPSFDGCYPVDATGDKIIPNLNIPDPNFEQEMLGRVELAFQQAYEQFEGEIESGDRI